MSQLTIYSINPQDETILHKIDKHLPTLTQDQKAALGVAAFYEAFQPKGIYFDYKIDGKSSFVNCLELMLTLSISGKLAVTRFIAEELAVYQRLKEVRL